MFLDSIIRGEGADGQPNPRAGRKMPIPHGAKTAQSGYEGEPELES